MMVALTSILIWDVRFGRYLFHPGSLSEGGDSAEGSTYQFFIIGTRINPVVHVTVDITEIIHNTRKSQPPIWSIMIRWTRNTSYPTCVHQLSHQWQEWLLNPKTEQLVDSEMDSWRNTSVVRLEKRHQQMCINCPIRNSACTSMKNI